MEQQCTVTLSGKTFADVIAQAESLVTEARKFQGPTTGTADAPTPKIRKTKSAKALQVEESEDDEESLDLTGTDETTTDEPELSFDDATSDDEEEMEEPTPKKKTTKITDKDINAAAMAHAKKYGRPKTMKILNDKFKVKSILELKTDKYPEVLKALKV